MSDLRRHDLSEERWLLLKPHLPGSKGNRGRRGDDDRLFLNALYGSCARERRGVICPWSTVTGNPSPTGFFGGETRVFGKGS